MDKFLLMKRGLYYRPENAGYTGIKDYAGRYPESDARDADGVTAIHEDDAPEYSGSCFADLAAKHAKEKFTTLSAELTQARAEIAAVIAWLKRESLDRGKKTQDGWALHWAARAIEQGQHLETDE